MNFKEWTIKGFLAVYIVVFTTCAMSFLTLPQMVIGAFISMVTGVFGYYFGYSTGSAAKDKIIQDNINTSSTPNINIIADAPDEIGIPKPR